MIILILMLIKVMVMIIISYNNNNDSNNTFLVPPCFADNKPHSGFILADIPGEDVH